MDKNISNEQIFEEAKADLQRYMDSKTDKDGNVNTSGMFDVRAYAKSKTKLWEEDGDLTYPEVVWKTLYNQVDKMIAQGMNPDRKKELDAQVESLDSLKLFQSQSDTLKNICEEVEKMVPRQIGFIFGAFENSDNNNKYIIHRDKMFELILKDKKISNAERVEYSTELLGFIENYSSKVLKEIELLNMNIQFKLFEFEKEFRPLAKASNEKVNHMIAAFHSWYTSAKRLLEIAFILSYAICLKIQSDKDLPLDIIKNNGNPDAKWSDEETKNYAKLYGSTHLLFLENEGLVNKIVTDQKAVIEKITNFFN